MIKNNHTLKTIKFVKIKTAKERACKQYGGLNCIMKDQINKF